MIACDTVVQPGQVQEEDTAVSVPGLAALRIKITLLVQVDEESIFTPIADGILPAFVIMYTI